MRENKQKKKISMRNYAITPHPPFMSVCRTKIPHTINKGRESMLKLRDIFV